MDGKGKNLVKRCKTDANPSFLQGGPMPGMRPTMGGPGMQPTDSKPGGTLGVMMPMFTIAIIVFFVYTTFKVGLIINNSERFHNFEPR